MHILKFIWQKILPEKNPLADNLKFSRALVIYIVWKEASSSSYYRMYHVDLLVRSMSTTKGAKTILCKSYQGEFYTNCIIDLVIDDH